MSEPYHLVEERIEHALDELETQDPPKFAATAAKWRVNRQRLTRRYRGGASRSTRAPTNRALDDDMEVALLAYVNRLDAIGTSARVHQLERAANRLLAMEWLRQPIETREIRADAPRLGHNWIWRFIKRHPDVKIQRQKPIDALRKMTHDTDALKGYFRKIKNAKDNYGIQDGDVWNYDETGFMIGVSRAQYIITFVTDRENYLAGEVNRELVTCCEAISASGITIPAMVILAATNILEGWVNNDLSSGTLLAVSETGYSNDDLALAWLHHFDKWSQRVQTGAYRMLILDGYGSHTTSEFIEYCDNNKIVLFVLPPHSTHLLQPLDVVVFQPYKHWHSEHVDRATRTGCTQFDKNEFLGALQSIRKQTFKPNTIRSAFRETGLVPFNPDVVLRKIRPPTPPPLPPTPDPATPGTPTTPLRLHALQACADHLRRRAGPDLSPTVERFIRGSVATAALEFQVSLDLKETRVEQQKRKERHVNSRRVIQKGGVITTGQARSMTQKRYYLESLQAKKRELKKAQMEKQTGNAIDHLQKAGVDIPEPPAPLNHKWLRR